MASLTDVRALRIDRLVVSKQQARTRDVEKDLDDLVDNIRVHGRLEPIIVAPFDGDEGRFEIIAGQRRWLAMQRLKADTILAAVLDERVDEATARALSISENIVRRDLNSKDLIDACTALHRKYGSIKAVAEELGLPYHKVRSYVKFERLRPELKSLVESSALDIRTAVRLEDHYGEQSVDPAELTQTVQAISAMTAAQQADYFKSQDGETRAGERPAGKKGSTTSPVGEPGAVRQIIVTLRKEDHLKLREWADGKNLGQDKAAAWIIHAFLESRRGGEGGVERAER